jgi:hypothetical protein
MVATENLSIDSFLHNIEFEGFLNWHFHVTCVVCNFVVARVKAAITTEV